VITNRGGQVVCGSLTIGGGSNWVFTGRYDQISQTGDAAFLGHAAGYAATEGTYGVEVLGRLWITEGSDRTGALRAATNLEIEFVEQRDVVDDSPFLYHCVNANCADMAGLRFHDLYLHDLGTANDPLDVGNGGVSIQGTPDQLIDEVAFYRNRVLRVHTCADFGWLGAGALIRQNVFAMCSLDRRTDPDRGDGIRLDIVGGNALVDGNIVVGSPGRALSLRNARQRGVVVASNNAFFDTGLAWVEIEQSRGLTYAFDTNYVRGRDFAARSDPSAAPTDYDDVFRILTSDEITIARTVWNDATVIAVSDPALANVELGEGNVSDPDLPATPFRDFLPMAAAVTSYLSIERWHASVAFAAGALVVRNGDLYRANTDTSADPLTSPADWRPLGSPSDDVRLASPSTYDGIGLP
jgi:hypothetical protein